MQSLASKLALVTGASSGIGAATARALAAAGARVVLAARRADRLAGVAGAIDGAETLELDVRNADEVAVKLGAHAFDVVVNNAGLALGTDKLQTGDPSDWQVVVDTNVLGVLNVFRATVQPMIERGSGDQVFLGSVAGRAVYPGGNVYCASKYAVRALYESARVDLFGTDVRVSTVDPAQVRTPFSEVRFKGDRARAEAVYRDMVPLEPEDVADAIVWAVSRPPHVNVGEIVLWPTRQASVTLFDRRPDSPSPPPSA